MPTCIIITKSGTLSKDCVKISGKQALCHLMMQPRCDKDSITPDAGLVSHSEGQLQVLMCAVDHVRTVSGEKSSGGTLLSHLNQ